MRTIWLRIAVLAALVIAALVAAGCGGSSSSNSTDVALSFLPKNSSVVVAIDTNPNGKQWQNVNSLISRFPFAGQLKSSLKQRISAGGGNLNYDNDVKPILGNEAVLAVQPTTGATRAPTLGAGAASSAASKSTYVLALKPRDQGKAQKLIDMSPKVGSAGGADIHQSAGSNSFSALADGVLLIASRRTDLEAAINRHGGSDHMTTADLDKLTAGLGSDALVRIGVNVQALIAASPNAAQARKSKWLGSVRDFGETISAQGDGIVSSFKATTEGPLSPSDLPIAIGSQSPAIVRRAGEIGFGLRDPAQTWRFGETVASVTNPKRYKKYAASKRRDNRKLGIDLDRDLIDQFTGDATLSMSLDGKVALRSGVRDPAALEGTLRKMVPRLKRLHPSKPIGVSVPKGRNGFFAVAQPNGKKTVFGVVGRNFVLGTDPARAAQMAGESPSTVPGAHGAAVMAIDTRSVANAAIQRSGNSASGFSGLFTGALGDFVGSAESTTSGLSGSFKLTIK